MLLKAVAAALVGFAAIVSSALASNGQDVFRAPTTSSSKSPNVIFILTDDQDLHMDSLNYMPYVQKHLIDGGTSFRRHFCTIAVCCPSRVNIWTGKAAHNTNVTDLWLP